MAGVIENWPMVVLFVVVFLGALVAVRLRGGPTVFAMAAKQAMSDTTIPIPVDGPTEPEVPLEWVGITVPWTDDRVAEIESNLRLDSIPRPDGPTGSDAVDGGRSHATV